MTPELLALLKEAIANGTDTTFFKDSGKTYARYDRIDICAKEKPEKGFLGVTKYYDNRIVVKFMLDGVVTNIKEIGPSSLATGDEVSLFGVNGAFEVDIK